MNRISNQTTIVKRSRKFSPYFACSSYLLIAAVLAILAAAPAARGQTTWYVDDNAPNDPGPGDPTVSDPDENGSAEHPFDAIQEGIDAAVDGDEVLVLDGTYTGEGNKNLDYAGKAITVRSESGSDNCVIDCENDGRGFYFHSGETADAIVDGFTITKGDTHNLDPAQGGGVFCDNSSPTLTNCRVTSNTADSQGGGIYCFESDVAIRNCAIVGNAVTGEHGRGAGIYCDDSNLEVTNCTITDHEIVRISWGSCSGAGIYSTSSDLTMIGCNVARNAIYRDYGGDGGGIYSTRYLTLIDCTIVANTATRDGGGLYCMGPTTVTRTTIIGNTAFHGGGGVFNAANGLTVVNSVVAENTAHYGGGVYSLANENLTIANCTIVGNTAYGIGGGFYCDSALSVTITNSILWNNTCTLEADTGSEIFHRYGDFEVTYSNVKGGWPGEGNIDLDPGFAFADDLHIMAGSPCIDAGTNDPPGGLVAVDRDGNPRPLDGDGDSTAVADMGAYEFNPDAPSIAVSPSIMEFFALEGEDSPASRLVSIRNAGGGILDWDILESCSWLLADPSMGQSTGEIDEVTLSIDSVGLARGTYDCLLEISDSQAINSPRVVHVTLHVGDVFHVPSDYETIQEAIDAAELPGDVVLVADGTYTGSGNKDLVFQGKPITVRSENGPDNCIIDCEGSGLGFDFVNRETATSVVNGFTVRNGIAVLGAGIHCVQASPTIANCIIMHNSTGIGGSISCYQSSPTILNCTIAENVSDSDGGGIFCWESSFPTIDNCAIMGNTALHGGGFYYDWSSMPLIHDCVIRENNARQGGGFYSDTSLVITNCVLAHNVATHYGAIFSEGSVSINNCTIVGNATKYPRSSITAGYDTTITNSILWANSSMNEPQVCVSGMGTNTLTVKYCVVEGGEEAVHADTVIWGPGNIDADPFLTRDVTHLQVTSPCRDAGDPDGDYTGIVDIDGETRVYNDRVDIGADEFVDTDADGLPDWWELCHFGSPTGGDPFEDNDDDGLNCLDEYAQSRDPLHPPRTYYVDNVGNDDWNGLAPIWDGVNGPKATIQAAIIVTHPYEGDQVSVAAGTYIGQGNKNLSLQGKAITVYSDGGPSNCIIDCENDGRGFHFQRSETTDSIVRGFTIQNAYPDINMDTLTDRGAIYCFFSSPVIDDCVIAGTTTEEDGAGIYCGGSSPAITNCIITGNVTTGNGGGVCCLGYSNPTIANCAIVDNEAMVGGGMHFGRGIATIINCAITANTADIGGGVYVPMAYVRMINCTIAANEASGGGGLFSRGDVTIDNCVFWADSAPLGAEIGLFGGSTCGSATISFSDVQGGQAAVYIDEDCTLNWGIGNIDADPLFVDPNDGDYRLSAGSPCIDAGCNCNVPWDLTDLDGDSVLLEYVPFDLDGEGRFFDDPATPDTGSGLPPIVDMGAYEFGDSDLPPCHGDLDGDRDVDLDDLVVLLAHYGVTSGANGADGDMDCDGDVEISDLAELLGVYGTVCD